MQTAFVMVEDEAIRIEIPDAESEVMPGVRWGRVEATATPAQWYYLVQARKQLKSPICNRIGETLLEELGACLLGGHGIPAYVGLASFKSLKAFGAFDGSVWSSEICEQWLREPLEIDGRKVNYRFARQKAIYLASAIKYLAENEVPCSSGRALRNNLINIKGVGYKTASWVARNWLDADDVAILDIHILRAGILANFFDSSQRVEKNYLELEEQFVTFSEALNVRASELDAEIWYQFSQLPGMVHRMFSKDEFMPGRTEKIKTSRPATQKRTTNPMQAALFI